MENAKQYWKILQKLETDLANRVQSFMVIGMGGEGVMVATEDGEGFWLGKMDFGLNESRTATKPTPLKVPGLVHMAHGSSHILLLNRRGDIYTMGNNNRGQLGLGTVDQKTYFLPQLITSPHKFTSIRCGPEHSLALTEDGKVWAWGSNYWSQVGVPSSADSLPSPRKICELDSHRVVAIECGGHHSLALTNRGEVYGFGRNESGELGDGLSEFPPTRITTPSLVQSMAAGHSHTLLMTHTGKVYACGFNGFSYPIDTESDISLANIAGLPPISQIASHPATYLSIAISSDQRCFVWGKLSNGTSISAPWELSTVFTTVESVLSSFSTERNTPHSVPVPAKECPTKTESCSDSVPDRTLPANSHLLDRIGKMFDNPDSSPDVRFQVEEQSILAHRSVLQISSGHFIRLFSSLSTESNPLSLTTSTLQSSSNLSQSTENPSEPDPNSTPITPQVTISIPDYSYSSFHAYLRFLYLGIFEVAPENLTDFFSLSVDYLESDLQQLCLSRMRTTLSPATCCLYYQYTLRHPMPELEAFQKELVHFISTNFLEVIDSAVYQSMDAELCKKLTLLLAKHSS